MAQQIISPAGQALDTHSAISQDSDMSLTELLDSWSLHLRAERKSPQTVKTYTDGVAGFLTWADAQGCEPTLDAPTVDAFVVSLLDSGRSASTAASRQLALRRFSAWLAEEGEIDRDRLAGLKAPKIDKKVIEPLSTEEIKALIKACQGATMRDRRDEAVIRLMVETGMRAGEVVSLGTSDVDLRTQTAIVRRGKGGKGRVVPFGAKAATSIDRYLRTRRTHRLAESPDLWLGDRGKKFSYDALHKAITMRGRAAGIDRMHPHLLRHTAAHRWLAAGGSEQGLMAVAGWTRPDMLMRYTQAQASQRAVDEAHRLQLGDDL